MSEGRFSDVEAPLHRYKYNVTIMNKVTYNVKAKTM